MRTPVFMVPMVLAATLSASAQDPPATKPVEKQDPQQAVTVEATSGQRPDGLPSALQWKFNFNAGWGTFGFANSLHNNPHDPGVAQDLSDQWFEGFIKPALAGVYTTASESEFYGKVSAVGERTYGTVPDAFGTDVSSFGPDDLYIGWRSGKSMAIGENALDFSIGRAPFQLGHGFLLYDGTSEGGSRGGYWTNARKAFELAAIARFAPGPHTIETFYLDRDELPESDSGSRLWGTNYEIAIGGADAHTTLGATYMRWLAHEEEKPGRDGLNVVNVRAYTAPFAGVRDLSFEFEYAAERNGERLQSDAWALQAAYQWSEWAWEPKISYRYAFFEGDDPDTAANEAFDPLFLGFSDWGTWWQGEIAGEYFLSNSNLQSHQLRAHVEPNEALSGGLMLFKFTLDHPSSFAPQVTSNNVAFEIDVYADWKLNKNFTLSLVGAYADPAKAVQEFSGRTKNFVYGMAYIGYAF